MARITNIIDAFFKGIARSRVSLLGAMITTVTFPFLLSLIIVDIWFHIDNPYFGAVIYMLLGPAFMVGLVMVFIGLFFLKGKEEVRLFTLDYLREHFTDASRFVRVRRLIFFGVFLTIVNFLILGLLSYSGYHYMESNAFCGKFCHSVMHPEYTAYQNSPHSRVKCIECHIGSGATWFAKSKLSGTRQLFAVVLDTYSKPIETPVHDLRPARETCEQCHRPEKFHGEKLSVRNKYLTDEENTEVKTVLLMKIGSAGSRVQSPHGIHWHVAPENKITFTADRERLTIPVVTLTKADGSTTVFRSGEVEEGFEPREMDCIDCHNRPTHIYQPANDAINENIFAGEIPAELPFIKKMAMEVVTREYDSQEEALAQIESTLQEWYQQKYPDLIRENPSLLATAIQGIQGAYAKNVFPEMDIEWDTYVNHIGHGEDFDIGCFRCHDGMHESETGEVISSDCDTCHLVLAEEEKNPEILDVLRGE